MNRLLLVRFFSMPGNRLTMRPVKLNKGTITNSSDIFSKEDVVAQVALF